VSRKEQKIIPSPRRIRLLERVANCIVLQGKERVQELETNPPVVTEAGTRRAVQFSRQEILLAIFDQLELSIWELRPQRAGDFLAGPINLRAVPPGRVHVPVARTCLIRLVQRSIWLGSGDCHDGLAIPCFTFWQRNVYRRLLALPNHVSKRWV